MDRTEEDMKHIGFFGIFKTSFKTIFAHKKIFSQITLVFILPLALTFIIHMEFSHRHFWIFQNHLLPLDANVTYRATTMEWFYYALFTFAYFIFLTIFSTLSSVAVVFTVASNYTNREVCFRDVIKVISKVWKRLCVTFIFIYIVQFIYDVIGNIVTGIVKPIIFDYVSFGLGLLIIVSILYAYGFFYLTVVCQLASVITFLEKIHGFKALKKGKALASGKKSVGMGISVVLYGVLVGIIIVYLLFVEYGHEVFKWALIWRVLMGILCGFLLLMLLLVLIVTQTMLYLVCKSYHGEVIDKLSLSTFLDAYIGDTMVVPRSCDEIQLGCPQSPTQQV